MIIDQGWKIIIIFLKTFFHHKKKTDHTFSYMFRKLY